MVGEARHGQTASVYEQRACGKSPHLPFKFAANFFVVVFAVNFKWLSNMIRFPGSAVSKESACSAGDTGSIPASG